MIRKGNKKSGNASENSSEFSDEDDDMVKVLELVINNDECMLFCHESMMEGRKLDFIAVLKAFAPVVSGFRSSSTVVETEK